MATLLDTRWHEAARMLTLMGYGIAVVTMDGEQRLFNEGRWMDGAFDGAPCLTYNELHASFDEERERLIERW